MTGIVCAPKGKATFKIPANSLLGTGTKPGTPGFPPWLVFDTLKSCSSCFLVGSFASIKAQPKLTEGPYSVTPHPSYGALLCLLPPTSMYLGLIPYGGSSHCISAFCVSPGVSCLGASWSLSCRLQLCGTPCISYSWCSVPPSHVAAGPKIILTLVGLVGTRCTGSMVHLAAEKGHVLALLSSECVNSS